MFSLHFLDVFSEFLFVYGNNHCMLCTKNTSFAYAQTYLKLKQLNKFLIFQSSVVGCAVAVEFGRFCRSDQWNIASWPMEFGQIFRRKLHPRDDIAAAC